MKICGVVRPGDARVAVDAGARWVGAILTAGFPRSVEPRVARSFARPPGGLVGVFVDEAPARLEVAARAAGSAVIQLHGDEDPGDAAKLRDAGPWSVWKVLRVRSPGDVLRGVERYAGVVDGLLFDGGAGGTGERFAWSVLESEASRIPDGLTVAVAGGLTAENVGDAIARFDPDIVDVSSGVEASVGVKDPERVRRFVEAAATRPVGRP